MTTSNETNSAAPNLNNAPVGSDSNSGTTTSENKSEAPSGEQGERRPRRFGKHPFKNRKPRGDRPPRQEGGERTPHTPGEQKVKPTFDPAQSDALFASVVSGEFDAALDAPEAEIANPDLANSSDEIAVSHHAGVERNANRQHDHDDQMVPPTMK
jgi:23S rRNA pseudouridine2605 synthase